MDERTDEWKRVKHILYSAWCFSQSVHSRKVMASIQRFFFGKIGVKQLELSLQVSGSSNDGVHSQEPGLIS